MIEYFIYISDEKDTFISYSKERETVAESLSQSDDDHFRVLPGNKSKGNRISALKSNEDRETPSFYELGWNHVNLTSH